LITAMLALPFTRDEFFAVFAAYNVNIWPLQLVAYGLAFVAIAALWLGPPLASRIALAVMSLLWAWTGGVYHILYFADINRAAFGFGGLFIVQAVLFAVEAWRARLRFSVKTPAAWGWTLIFYALFMYPLLGLWSGHVYPAAPMFGVTPCPLVIFTLGLMLFNGGPIPWRLLIIPVLWSVIGGSAAFLLAVYPDWVLPVSAGIVIALNWQRARGEP
jgi:hypothetical protein